MLSVYSKRCQTPSFRRSLPIVAFFLVNDQVRLRNVLHRRRFSQDTTASSYNTSLRRSLLRLRLAANLAKIRILSQSRLAYAVRQDTGVATNDLVSLPIESVAMSDGVAVLFGLYLVGSLLSENLLDNAGFPLLLLDESLLI